MAWKLIQSLREHHSATVNVVVLLNHATYGGAFQWFSVSIIEIWKSFKIDTIGSEDRVLTATQALVVIAFLYLKNTQLQFVSFMFIGQFFIYENVAECSQVLYLYDERYINF